MPDVHPSALIDPEVVIADDTYIGPGCVLRGQVTIGPGCKLHGNTYIHGPLTMGSGNKVYPFTCLGFAGQDIKYDPAKPGAGTIIGNDNIFREGFTVHRATRGEPTRIGHRNFCMANSHVGHDSVIGDDCTLVNGALVGGHVEIHDRVILGGNSGVHQFCRMGRMSMISGVVAVTQDVPPFAVVHYMKRIGSLNLVGLRRAGLRDHIRPLQLAFDIFFRERLSNKPALERIERELGSDPLCMEFVHFIRASKRGITAYAHQDNIASLPNAHEL